MSEVTRKFEVGDEVWFFDCREMYYGSHTYSKGVISQICDANGMMCFVEEKVDGVSMFHSVEMRHLFASRKEAYDHRKGMIPFKPGDLITYVEEDWSQRSPNTRYPQQTLKIGTCIKVTTTYIHIQADEGFVKVAKQHCIVSSRP